MPCEIKSESRLATREINKSFDLPLGIPPLTSLYFYISGSCNLACRHCWISPDFQQNPEDGKFLEPEYISSAIIQAKPLGLNSVKLTGGEPLLHPEFKKIVSLIEEEHIRYNLETNGLLLDKEMAAFLAEGKSRPFISVSVDGANARTHEDLRGVKGSFDLSIEGIINLVNAGIKPQMICTLHKDNVSEIEDIVSLASRTGCGSVKFNLVQEVGRGDDFARDKGLDVLHAISLNREVEKKLISQHPIKIFFDVPLAFKPIGRILRDTSRCYILNILGVLSGGDLSLCGIGTTVPELIYGHMYDKNLKEVWCESPGLSLLRDLVPRQFEGICNDCIHRDFCLGSCVANNYFRTRQLNAPYGFCEKAEKLNLFPESRKKIEKRLEKKKMSRYNSKGEYR